MPLQTRPPRYHILIIDDDPLIHDLIQITLSHFPDCQFEFYHSENGKEAIELLASQSVELIVTDLDMPEMNGLELIAHLRQVPQYENIPILFLTAYEDSDNKIQAFQLGATDYIVKPFIAAELKARITGYLERQRAYEMILHQQKEMGEQLKHAQRAQMALLPKQLPHISNARLACKYVPVQQVSGDLYDVLELKEDTIGLMVTDVTGHGIPAALLSFMIFGIFKDSAPGHFSPSEVLTLTNKRLFGNVPKGKFATMFYGIYDAPNQTFSFSNAAHTQGVVLRPDTNEIFSLETTGTIVGQFATHLVEYKQRVFHLISGDKLFLYTDGLVEVKDEQGVMMTHDHLEGFLRTIRHLPIEELVEEAYKYGLDYSRDKSFNDDVTLIGLEVS